MAVAVFVIIMLVFLYQQSSEITNEKSKLNVAASIFPLYDIVRSIGGDRVSAELLFEPGALSSPEQAWSNFDTADVAAIFIIGHGLDDQNIPPSLVPQPTRVDAGINLLLEDAGTASPYYWLSPDNASRIAETVAGTLIAVDPASAVYYEERLRDFKIQLSELDMAIRGILEPYERGTVATYGYDWSYFAADYNITIVASREPGLSPSEVISEIESAVSDYGLRVIFFDLYETVDQLIPLITEHGISLAALDRFGGTENRQDYFSLMRYNALTFAEGLAVK